MYSAEQARKLASLGIVVAVLAAGWLVYRPAFGGAFLLDDWSNLGGLSTVVDNWSAWQFILSGNAGPSGRPLALATFVPQAGSWPDSAAAFLRVNVLIHLVNAVLACFLFRHFARSQGARDTQAWLVAAAAMSLWLLLPLLASSSLMVVQRMATLSATAMLLGLNVYLLARAKLDKRPIPALTGMSAALVAGTATAILCKENGALLPTLVLVLELTILSRPQTLGPVLWRTWGLTFLVLPTLVILGYVASQLPYSADTILRREFTGLERLQSEALVLWQYLFNAVFPRPQVLGPFQDDYPVSRSLLDPAILAAIIGWAIASAAAVVLRRRIPVFSLAVLWYLAAHVLESTTVPLYLYFEHRNYVPLLGPVFALAYLAMTYAGRYKAIARIAFVAYVFTNAAVLLGITSLWGNPSVAAGYWYVNHPGSVYAVSNLAIRQSKDLAPQIGMQTYREFASAHPEHAYLRLPELNAACLATPERDLRPTIDDLVGRLPMVAYSPTVGAMLDNTVTLASDGACRDLSRETVTALIDAIARNPRYNSQLAEQSFVQQLHAKLARMSGDTVAMLDHLRSANSLVTSKEVQVMLVTSLVANDRLGEAQAVLDAAEDDLPLNPVSRLANRMVLDDLRQYIDAVRSDVSREP